MVKIFQIGFNKCGTRTLYGFFKSNHLRVVHWERGHIADTMHLNLEAGRPILSGISEYDFYSDMDGSGVLEMFKRFDEIYASYPDALFILNTRNVNDWIQSRLRHGDGVYAERHRRALRLSSIDDLVSYWRRDWYYHHARVLEFFKDKPSQLLFFDIDRDDGKCLVEFFSGYFALEERHYRHKGKTEGGGPIS